MILFGFDTETSGLTLKQDRILEVGCALYDTNTKNIIECYSSLVYDSSFPVPTEEAMSVNKISLKTLEQYGKHPNHVYENVVFMMNQADAVIAHNGNSFDKPFLEYELEKAVISMPDKPWIDTRYDVDYPPSMTSRRLSHLAVDHNVPIANLHRALADVELIFAIIKNYDIDEIYEKAKSPLIRIEADTRYEDRELAKKLRYNWDGKKWWKNIRESDFDKETQLAKFTIKRVT